MHSLLRFGLCLGLAACSGSTGRAKPDASQPGQDAGKQADATVRDASDDAAQDAQRGADAWVDAQASTPNSDPLTTPVDTWTFLPLEGARCANGTPTGVGIQRSTRSNDLVIYLQGGGACWDGATCFVLNTAIHIEDTYDEAAFQADRANLDASRDPDNPLSLATRVFVPYCTGDLHAGTVMREYEVGGQLRSVHHVGAHNIDALLDRLYAGLPEAERIWLLGSSAGGYGATFNLQAVEHTFASAEVHMLADSAPMHMPAGDRWTTWQAAWKPRLPGDCPDCPSRLGAVIDAIAEDERQGRIGLLAYEQDAVIAAYFGFDGPGEQQALTSLLDRSYGHTDTRYFIAAGDGHGMLASPTTASAQTGVVLSDCLVARVLGLPTWQNAR